MHVVVDGLREAKTFAADGCIRMHPHAVRMHTHAAPRAQTFSRASCILAKCASLWNVRARLLAASVFSRSVAQNSARHTSALNTMFQPHCRKLHPLKQVAS